MPSIKEIRDSIDVKLTKLDARADAFHAALEESKDHDERIKRSRQEVGRALDKLTANIDQQSELSDGRKQTIHSLVDNLNAQIADSKTASRETLAYARRQIHEASRKMETELDSVLAEPKNRTAELLRPAVDAYARAVDKLDAEFEASELRFESVRSKTDVALDKQRQETARKIAALKQRLAEQKEHAGERLADVETQLRGEFEQLAAGFKKLLG